MVAWFLRERRAARHTLAIFTHVIALGALEGIFGGKCSPNIPTWSANGLLAFAGRFVGGILSVEWKFAVFAVFWVGSGVAVLELHKNEEPVTIIDVLI